MKMGRAEFHELDDNNSDSLSHNASAATHTYITGGQTDLGNEGVPHNAIGVQTNMDWQHSSRES